MSQLDEAIARYHKILESDSNQDLSWAIELQAQMEAEKLSFGGRLICPFLRPHSEAGAAFRAGRSKVWPQA